MLKKSLVVLSLAAAFALTTIFPNAQAQAGTYTAAATAVKAPVTHVTATIKQVKPDGGGHHHLIVNNVKVVGGYTKVDNELFVAIRYGDSLGLPKPIPGLKAGQTIELQGEYIDKSDAYPTPDNPGDSVLHFTHHPVGYVIYKGVKYQ